MISKNFNNSICFKIFFSIGICIVFISCQRANELRNDRIIVRPDIIKNPIYKKLDSLKDTREFGPPDETLTPKTSDVWYVNDRFRKTIDTTYARMYNCKGYLKNDSLQIVIGIGDGFTAWGFSINCTNNLFNVEPYYETDVILKDPPNPTFKIIYQNLILNKSNFALGDSVFGKVNFKIIENDGITHIGNGYFRGRIIKMP